jgi:archaellum biogenesis ATPase FlaH
MKIKEVLGAETKDKEMNNDLFFTGLRDVDKVIGGIEPGELMIVSGAPSVGKTAFCLSAAMNAGVKNIKTLYLTGKRPEYMGRRPGTSQVKDPAVSSADKFDLSGMAKTADLPIYFEDEDIEGIGIDEIEEAIPSEMEQILQHFAYNEPAEETKDMEDVEKYTRVLTPWLLIIDPIDHVYRYYPKQEDQGEFRSELLRKYIKKVKILAKKYNAAVIVTANALEADSGAAELSREVASCAPLAEVLCLLNREDREDLTKRSLEILKNTHGCPGAVSLGMERGTGMLKDHGDYIKDKEGGK